MDGGHKPSDNAKKMVSDKLKGIKRSRKTKNKLSNSHSYRVYQYDKNGNFIQSFKNSLEAKKKTNSNPSHIRSLCNFAESNRLVNGFFWSNEYIDDPKLIVKFINKEINIPKKPSKIFKKVIQYDEQKKIIGIYSSIKRAGEINNITPQAITYACKNHTIAGNYYWEYLEKDFSQLNYFVIHAHKALKEKNNE